MEIFSLNALIDDILLTARNNAISQSEDLSRAQIESWIHQYRAMLIKQTLDKGYDIDNSYVQELTNVQISQQPINTIDTITDSSTDRPDYYKYRTITTIPKPINLHNGDGIIIVSDLYNSNIQRLYRQRSFFQKYRKYTSNDYGYYYSKPYVYLNGPDALRYINIRGIFENPIDAGLDPDDVYPMPVNMVPTLKQMLFTNELKFMFSSPSDDRNDASLDTIKPHGETK